MIELDKNGNCILCSLPPGSYKHTEFKRNPDDFIFCEECKNIIPMALHLKLRDENYIIIAEV